jgi:DNA-binding Lrp family transcriptional regulator
MRALESPGSLQWNIRESYASIAKKLGVDEETIRKRVARVRQGGILKEWQLVINPHLMGRESASVDLQVEDSSTKRLAITRIRLIEGVISILDLHGQRLQVGIYYRHEHELARQLLLMESICGGKYSMLWNIVFPPCELKMTRTDWVLLSILRNDPRRRLTDIALDANASTRTVNRRLKLMVAGYAFFLHAEIDFKKLGGLAYRMLLHFNDPGKKAKADELVLAEIEKIEWSYTLSEEYSMFILHCENVAEAENISNFARNLDGLREFRMDIIDDQITVHDWIDEEIELRASGLRTNHGTGSGA